MKNLLEDFNEIIKDYSHLELEKLEEYYRIKQYNKKGEYKLTFFIHGELLEMVLKLLYIDLLYSSFKIEEVLKKIDYNDDANDFFKEQRDEALFETLQFTIKFVTTHDKEKLTEELKEFEDIRRKYEKLYSSNTR